VAQWGPFEIQEELFDRAKKQAALLSSGAILYKAVDPFTRPAGYAINCEHAVCDIGLRPGKAIERTGTAHGHHGSYLVATHLRSWMIEPGVSHDLGEPHAQAGSVCDPEGGLGLSRPGIMEPPGVAVASRVAEKKDQTAQRKTEKKRRATRVRQRTALENACVNQATDYCLDVKLAP